MTLIRLVLFLLFLCVAAFSTWAAAREHASFLIGKTPLLTELQNIDGRITIPLSNSGQTQRLMRCAQGMRSLEMRLLPNLDQMRLTQSCRDLAARILQRNPSRALAHLTRAIAADRAGDFRAMQASLVRAHAHAPQEGWLADWRMRLALPYFENLSQVARIGVESDVALLMGSSRLRRVVVAQYLHNESSRAALIAVAEKQPADVQAAFFSDVRKGMGA